MLKSVKLKRLIQEPVPQTCKTMKKKKNRLLCRGRRGKRGNNDLTQSLSVFRGELLDQFLKRGQLLPVNQVELLNEEDEVFEGGVEMGLLLQLDDRVKVLVVNMSIDPEKPLQDGLRHRHEVLWERNAYFRREKCFIIELILNPGHQVINVLWSRALDWLFNVGPIGPVVLILGSSRH